MRKYNSIICTLVIMFVCKFYGQADTEYLISVYDTINGECAFKNLKNEIIIPYGKYPVCYTDTLKTYAVVLKSNVGFIAIDRNEKMLYKIFPFDNGPDYESDGLFRIVESNKIGYADFKTGKVVIKPQFDCADFFKDGIALVSNNCKIESDGEHSTWKSDEWFYINKKAITNLCNPLFN